MKGMTADKAIEISRNIASVIAHMHSYDLVHRDIKPENILMDEHEQVYLADFGTCQHGTENHTITGSLPLPPDIAALASSMSSNSSADRLQSYNGSAVDVYLLGILMFVCAPKENYMPPSTINSEQVQRLDRQKVPESYCELILRCLDTNSKKRPATKEIIDELDLIAKSLCMICQKAPRFVRCLPCQHKTTCLQCHQQLQQRSDQLICILCQQVITHVQQDNDTNTFFVTPN
jgi:serine/threonine protein kinase